MRREKKSNVAGRLRAAGVVVAMVCALVVTVLALGSSGAKAATTVQVTILSGSFSPSTVTINVGDTVTWTNNNSLPHNTISNTVLWNSGVMGQGDTFSHTFTQ